MHRNCKKLCDKHDKGMIEKLMNGQIHIHYFHLKFCIEVTVGIAAGLIFTYMSQLAVCDLEIVTTLLCPVTPHTGRSSAWWSSSDLILSLYLGSKVDFVSNFGALFTCCLLHPEGVVSSLFAHLELMVHIHPCGL